MVPMTFEEWEEEHWIGLDPTRRAWNAGYAAGVAAERERNGLSEIEATERQALIDAAHAAWLASRGA